MDTFAPPQGRKQGKRPGAAPEKPQVMNHLVTALLVLLALMTLYSYVREQSTRAEEVPISTLADDVRAGRVAGIVVHGEDLTISYKDESTRRAKKELGTALSETFGNYGVTTEMLAAVEMRVEEPSGLFFLVLNLLPFMLPVFFIVFFLWFLSRQVRGAGMQAFSFGQSRARLIDPRDKSQKAVTFKDVAGVKEAKEELQEIVEFLKHPKKFLDIGARIPKGVLLMGPAGTGKTLLARAVAGEAGVPFFSVSGSEFVELFVGVGAARTRDLFRMAKKAAPAIIFIDEIDAVGRVRGGGLGGGNDEREQTLNQILVEMDGFEPTEKVIVLAASNMAGVLDPALLRPGRFDRRITLDMPDREEREQILLIHANHKPLGEDVNMRVIAERTPGLSGADLQNLMNEAAILAARENRKKITQYDIIRSIEKVMLGPERKSHLLSRHEKEITAYHEAGHALVASVLPQADPVHKVSIVSRGHAGGYTLKLPLEERRLKTRREFTDELAAMLGGYAAEVLLFDDVSTGPSNDLAVATALAREMVVRYGMSEVIGPLALEEPLGRMSAMRLPGEKDYSEEVAAKVDAEVNRLMNEARSRAHETLVAHRAALESIAHQLIEQESIERDEFEKLLIVNGIVPKKKSGE
ncbi:MAG: ATP-dependent zinc metalloprotease FtsH [bacterium]|nr:ATP-dependent zinc metalloprotease FtsH [bacterium]MDZ4284470.1 ATP-dependent zinc metalloprotease FtsH [Patescibacteria group bacterium]